MITIVLKLRYAPRALRETQAWYIPTDDPAIWLDEVTSWDVDQAEVRLWPVPRGSFDRAPGGVLATLAKGALPAKTSGRCIAFGRIAGGLYLPVDGWLEPEVSDAELKAILAEGCNHLWHPSAGLIAFAPDDALEIGDLLAIPDALSRRWDFALPGVALSARLTTLLPDEPPTFEGIMDEARGDIGSDGGQVSELPPSKLEPTPGVMSSMSRQGMRMVASVVHWLAEHAPHTSKEPTWINQLENWAANQLSRFYRGLDAERNKELTRLMELLESDPDRGLRFALPLTGDAHRGQVPPGARLGERPTNFDLRRLGGGRAADVWDLSNDHRHKLTVRYRELANRELHLGRHRRAAYIFAELLGDFDAAAGALVDGHHWREAAVLYRDRLKRPLDAARCLEQGGLKTEAIELYIELNEHVRAGDLYLELDQREAAHAQYRQAHADLRVKGERVAAARLLETKLEAVDEAIEELQQGWPNSTQAALCLREYFQMVGRHGRHDVAERRVVALREEVPPARSEQELIEILADTATKYPDRRVQATAADSTRVLVSQRLGSASKSAARTMLAAIGRLVPQDRLLHRDTQRYLQQVHEPPPAIRPKATQRNQGPKLIRTLQLPGLNVTWKAAISIGSGIFAAGHVENQLVLFRSGWEETDRPGKMWDIGAERSTAPLILTGAHQWPNFVLLHAMHGPLLRTEHEFQSTDVCPFATKAGPIRGMSAGILAADGATHGVIWLLESRGDELTLIAIGPQGEQISTETVELPEVSPEFAETPSVLPVPFHARDQRLYIGLLNKLLVCDKVKQSRTLEFEQPITSLAGSAPYTLTRVAITFPRGGMLLWDDSDGTRTDPFGMEMVEPVACINRGGQLIAATEGFGQVYNLRDRQLRFDSEFAFGGQKPIAILAAPRANQFGMVSRSGQILVYEMTK